MDAKNMKYQNIYSETVQTPLVSANKDKVLDKKIINLSIGEPNFPVDDHIINTIIKKLREGETQYCDPQGLVLLRKKIINKYASNAANLNENNVLIGTGVSNLLNLIFLGCIPEKGMVLLIEPYYFSYKLLLDFYGINYLCISETFCRDDLNKINNKIDLILFSNPSNPTGYCMTKAQLSMLADFASHEKAILVSDEIYREFDYDGVFVSALNIYPRTIVLVGFSKAYSMTGLRLGALIAHQDIVNKLLTIQTHSQICVPAAIQWGGIAALELDISNRVNLYKENRNYFYNKLKDICKIQYPQGSFYFWICLDSTISETQAINLLLEKNIMVSPGSLFTANVNFIRVSFCTSKTNIMEATKIVKGIL